VRTGATESCPVSFPLVTHPGPDEPGIEAPAPAPPPGPAPTIARADPTPPRRPRESGPVQYRGAPLEPARGPGLGCFRIQLVVLAVFLVLTPLTVLWKAPPMVSAILLIAVIVLLLVTGQTIIFLLRLVAADRRGRRRPLDSGTKTVGELEDEASADEPAVTSPTTSAEGSPDRESDSPDERSSDEGPVRQ